MANPKRMYTRDGLAVFGRDGVVEYDRSRRWVFFHRPDTAGLPCDLLEMACDTSPLHTADELFPGRPAVDDGEMFAALEDLYARETR